MKDFSGNGVKEVQGNGKKKTRIKGDALAGTGACRLESTSWRGYRFKNKR
jgi:hypothetical protein